MRLEYQITAEDYAEVNRGHARFRPWIILWVIGLMWCLVLLPQDLPSGAASVPSGQTRPTSLWNDLILPFAPWVLVLVLIWGVVFGYVRRVWRKPWLRKPGRRTRDNPWLVGATFGVLLGAIVAMLVVAVRTRRGTVSDPRESPALEVLLPLVPMALGTVAAVFVVRRYRGVFRRGWESQPQLHRPFVAEVDERGLRLSEPLSRHEYHWDYFPGWIETENVFAIYVSPVSFHLLPKRAFADEAARTEFRKLLKRVISDRTNAFPVIPMATARPPTWTGAEPPNA